jgi:hypothetical protein
MGRHRKFQQERQKCYKSNYRREMLPVKNPGYFFGAKMQMQFHITLIG